MKKSSNLLFVMIDTRKILQFTILVVTSSSILLAPQESLGGEITEKNVSKKITQIEEKISPGASLEYPIVLKGVKNYNKVKELQREYMRKKYEGYNILAEFFNRDKNGHFIQHFLLHDNDGNAAQIFFDITDACKNASKLKRKENNELIEKIKKLDSLKYGATK